MEKKPNLIDRDALLAQYSHPDELIYTFDVMDRIREAPAVDAVEVVRCKDCQHEAGDYKYYCSKHDWLMGADDFCSYGKRREGMVNSEQA